MKANTAIARLLQREGVEYLFCYPSNTLIEACAVGVSVLIGPHVFNFTQATADAVAAGAAVQVQDPADLARALRFEEVRVAIL